MKNFLVKIHWVLSSQFGIDPVKFWLALRLIPRYLRDRHIFKSNSGVKLNWVPCFHDRCEEAGITKSEYFWQDLVVARWIHEANPMRHVDVGSRTDGFVAHVASFRNIEIFDVRPLSTAIPGVTFRQADLLDESAMSVWQSENIKGGYCDSLSCLHVLEHLGLGRYGDRIDPSGYKTGFANLSCLLQPNGHLYLSTPIGQERVEFNANWVFDPINIIEMANAQGLRLKRLYVFNTRMGLFEINDTEWSASLTALAGEKYNLGIFVFIKMTD